MSFIPGEIDDYVCNDEKVMLSKNLSLPLSSLKSISYNDEKCNKIFSSTVCNSVKSSIDNITTEQIEQFNLTFDLNILGDAFEELDGLNQELILYIITAISDIEYKESKNINKHLIFKIGGLSFSFNNLSLVALNNNITDIDFGGFVYNKINKIYLSNNLKIIGDSAFMYNQLIEVNIPDRVESIGSGAFEGNSSGNAIKKLTLGNNVKEIKYNAFYNNCLSSIEIPSSVTSIDAYSFKCNNLKLSNINNLSSINLDDSYFDCANDINTSCSDLN